jgi:hypothetical protein
MKEEMLVKSERRERRRSISLPYFERGPYDTNMNCASCISEVAGFPKLTDVSKCCHSAKWPLAYGVKNKGVPSSYALSVYHSYALFKRLCITLMSAKWNCRKFGIDRPSKCLLPVDACGLELHSFLSFELKRNRNMAWHIFDGAGVVLYVSVIK